MQLQELIEKVKHGNAAVDKKKLDECEHNYSVWRAGGGKASGSGSHHQTSSVSEIAAAARKNIGDVLKDGKSAPAHSDSKDGDRISKLEKENVSMRQELSDLRKLVECMRLKIDELSTGKPATKSPAAAAPPATKPKPAKESDDEVDLFGSDDEDDDEKARVREERLKAYAKKKEAKPALIAKSSVILDVKPWDDETNMQEMEKAVRTIQMDGLVWGASKLVPLAYGIKKLQIMCVVEDEKVSVDELQEKIQAFEDFIQSVDIAAFNKI
jgi:translation elongation factor EF-1beta